MATSGLLPTFQVQQIKYINGVPVPPVVQRRTLRIREKYVVLLVFAMFGLVCFGGIFYLPDMRDRGAVSDGPHGGGGGMGDNIGNLENMFIPRFDVAPPRSNASGGGGVNRHGQPDRVKDPHDENDKAALLEQIKLQQRLPNLNISESDRLNHLQQIEEDKKRLAVKQKEASLQQEATMKTVPQGIDHEPEKVFVYDDTLDNVTKARQEKIKQVSSRGMAAFGIYYTNTLIDVTKISIEHRPYRRGLRSACYTGH